MELSKRQEEIIQAAIAIIARQGFKYLTTKNLAREMRLTEAALYRHFASKDELIGRILDYFACLSCEILDRIRDGELDALARARRFVMNRYELFSSHPDLARVMFSEEMFQHDPSLAGRMQEIQLIHREAMLGFLSEARAAGQIDPGLDEGQLFRIIIGSMRFLVSQWNLGDQSFDLEAEGNNLWNTIEKLIEVKK